MAKVKFGMMMTDARGKLGGQVFSKNRSGAYVRTKVTPVNPRTAFQQNSRALLGSLSQQWSGLTREQIEAWNHAVGDWAKTDIFGDLRNPTGKNLFVEVNKNRIQAGYALTTTPPIKEEMPIVVLGSVRALVAEGTITASLEGNQAGHTLQFRATPKVSNGTTFVKDKLRVVDYSVGASSQTVDLTTAYEERFGSIDNLADNVFFEMRVVLPTGQVSPAQVVRVEVDE